MPFEVFNRKSASRTPEPMVTIQKRGTFSLNLAAAQLLSGGHEFEKLAVELLYDSENRAVGLRRAVDSPLAYILRKQDTSNSFILAGHAFTTHYGIDTRVSRRYRATITDDILGFGLDDRHVEVTKVGRPKRDEFDEKPNT